MVRVLPVSVVSRAASLFAAGALLCHTGFPREPYQIPGEWIIKTQAGQLLARDSSLKFVARLSTLESLFLYRESVPSRTFQPEKLAGVVWARPNFRYQALDVDPFLEQSWAIQNYGQLVGDSTGISGVDLGLPAAWKIQATAENQIVAVIDTGTDLGHEELASNLWRNPGEIAANGIDDDGNGYVDDTDGWNFVANNNKVSDDNDHGTFCAGIIGAQANNGKGSRGAAAEARVMTIKFLDSQGGGTTANAVRAIEYAVNNGASVINASWGTYAFDQTLLDSLVRAGNAGVLIVAASGNDAQDNDSDIRPTYPASYRLPNLISVSAYNSSDQIAKFSNWGKTTVDLGAPGVDIFSTISGGYRLGDGTSFAAPFVSAVALLLKAHEPQLPVAKVKERLIQTSVVTSYYDKEKSVSAGRVSAYNALRGIFPPRPEPPTRWYRRDVFAETPHPYENKSSLRWEFEEPFASHVRVHFKQFATERGCDKVTLKDGKSNVITTYQGELGEFISADALGDKLIVEFASDYSITASGLVIDYLEWAREDRWERREAERLRLPRLFAEFFFPGRISGVRWFPPEGLLLQRLPPNRSD